MKKKLSKKLTLTKETLNGLERLVQGGGVGPSVGIYERPETCDGDTCGPFGC